MLPSRRADEEVGVKFLVRSVFRMATTIQGGKEDILEEEKTRKSYNRVKKRHPHPVSKEPDNLEQILLVVVLVYKSNRIFLRLIYWKTKNGGFLY